jgi:hypothetical protein
MRSLPADHHLVHPAPVEVDADRPLKVIDEDVHLSASAAQSNTQGKDTYLVGRIRGRKRARPRVRIGAPDASLTAVSGMAAVSELCDRLGVSEALDVAVRSIKQRARGHSAGALLVGLAAAQLAGQDHLAGLDRLGTQRASQALVAGSGSTTAAGAGPADQHRGVGGGGDRDGHGDRADASPVAPPAATGVTGLA